METSLFLTGPGAKGANGASLIVVRYAPEVKEKNKNVTNTLLYRQKGDFDHAFFTNFFSGHLKFQLSSSSANKLTLTPHL